MNSRFSILSYLDISRKAVQDVINNVKSFKLKQRCKHVYEEAKRVLLFKEKCLHLSDKISAKNTVNNVVEELGALMNASHESLRDYYECSCNELDTLQQMCSSILGCFGCRLTGAGWGGMVVSLVQEQHASAFIEQVKKLSFERDGQNYKGNIEEVLFVSSPCNGAIVKTLPDD